jgi:putative inorganic carbon (hco3(-)) transporter
MGLFRLRPAILESALFGGWARLAVEPASLWSERLMNSGIGKLFDRIAHTFTLPEGLTSLCEKALLLGCIVLLIVLTFLDTGPIGLITWALFFLAVFCQTGRGFSIFKTLNIIDVGVMLFFLSAVVSTAFSSFLSTSLVGLSKMATFVAGYWSFRCALLCAPVMGQKPFQLFLYTLFGLGLFETLVGFYQYINHIQPLATWEDPSVNPELKMNRIFGTLKPSNPNLLAGFLIPALAAGLGFSLTFLSSQKWLKGCLCLLGALVILLGLVLTGSRGGFLAIGVMGLATYLMLGHLLWHDPGLNSHGRLKKLWFLLLILAVLAVGLALMASPALQHRLFSIFAMREDSSNAYRLNVYGSAWRMFLENPWVGIGPGNATFKLVYGLYMVPGFNALGSYSVPLEIAVEQGIPGVLLFFFLLGCVKFRMLLSLEEDSPLAQRLWVLMLYIGISGSIVYGLFDTIWYRPSVNLVFWLFVAMLATITEPLLASLVQKTQAPKQVSSP